MKFWLFKSEPSSFSIDDLAASADRTTHWEGVRNFQARNFLRDDVARGDKVLFYHSNAKPSGIVGDCDVTRAGYPDHFALDPNSKYFDPKASKDNPIWYMVDVKLNQKFNAIIPLTMLKKTPGLERMMVCQRGTRLSIQPVTADEWEVIVELAAQM
jgi:predicted RNA-binding protein with PUA-like domain